MKNKYYAIFGVVFLLLSLVGAIYLTFQNADTRNKAEGGRVTRCKDLGSPKARQECTAAHGGDENALIDSGDETVACKNNGTDIFCGGCGGFCTSGATKTCDQAILAKCGEYPTRGSTITGIGACTPSSAGTACECGPVGSTTHVCFSNQNVDAPDKGCNRTDGNSLCDVWSQRGNPKSMDELNQDSNYSGSALYFCPNRFLGQDGSSCTTAPPANFNVNCYCGTIQVDYGSGFKSQSMNCGCTKDTPEDTPTPTTRKNTPTPTRTRTPTPTFVIITDTPTPPTPTPTTPPGQPTNTPVPPTNTPVPTSTPVPAYLGCGYTPCDNGGKQCTSGLVCITANNSAQYCSLPQYTATCATNPGYTGCCTAPLAQGPSPTRIILPISGVEFPSQALTIIGSIATLLGFLILL